MPDNITLTVVSVVVLLAAALGAGYYFMSQQGTNTATITEDTVDNTTTEAATGDTGLENVTNATSSTTAITGVQAPMGMENQYQNQHRNRNTGDQTHIVAQQCGGDPQTYIMELFGNKDRFQFNYTFYDNNMTLVWVITAETPELAETLKAHIEQMECILENGGTPRKHDPVFQLEAKMAPYINTEIIMLNETTMKIIKTAENQCAYETIKLHAEVIEGFFTAGMEEARQQHPIPEDVLQICEPYLTNG